MTDPAWRTHRLRTYLGLLAQLEEVTVRVRGDEGTIILRGDLDEDSLPDWLSRFPAGQRHLKQPEHMQKLHRRGYMLPMIAFAKAVGHDGPFLLTPGDIFRAATIPAFARARPCRSPGLGVLVNLHEPRHFGALETVDRHDIPWREKEERIVWRGATTGEFRTARGRRDFTPRFYVHQVNARVDDPRIDVGYSEIARRARIPAHLLPRLERNIKPRLAVAEQLRAKYVLSLEGNDVASGLNWQLYSNSLVVMPQPTMCSWAMEGDLVPFEHYVPVAPDLRDIDKVLEWCVDNDAECERIARNGRAFIESLRGSEAETALVHDVVAATLRKVRWTRASDADFPVGML